MLLIFEIHGEVIYTSTQMDEGDSNRKWAACKYLLYVGAHFRTLNPVLLYMFVPDQMGMVCEPEPATRDRDARHLASWNECMDTGIVISTQWSLC
jgi:hypothetical protein